MFHGDRCPACRAAYPDFQEAAWKSGGMVKFGNVDVSVQQELGGRFQIMGIPTFIVFYPGGQKNYNGPRTSRHFLNFASRYIPKSAEIVDESWLPDEETKETILFSTRAKAPALWNAIAGFFQNRKSPKVRVGFTSDSTLMPQFNVTAQPTILMIDGNNTRVYNGKNNYTILKKTLVDFYNGIMPTEPVKVKPTPPPVIIGNITSMEMFEEKCKGHGFFCVVQGTNEPEDDFKEIAKKYRRDPFKFVTCGVDCPLKGLSEKVAIFHKVRPQFFLTSVKELPGELDRIIDGTAPWKKYPPEETSKDL